jgi:Tfp pilus assembly protein PilO
MFRIIGPILSILIAGAAIFFFVKPMFVEIQAVQAETKGYTDAIDKATQFNVLLASLLEKKNSFSTRELDRLETLVPDQIDGVRALVDLERLATSHGLLFSRVTVDLAGEGIEDSEESSKDVADGSVVQLQNGLRALDIEFSVVGGYSQFKSFLEDVERSLVLMDISELTFQTQVGELTNYNVTVRLYGMSVGQ